MDEIVYEDHTHSIIKWMTFRTDAIRIHVDLAAPIDQYYNIIENRGDFLSGIEYSHSGNTLKKMCPERTAKYERNNRIAMGHVQTVQYIAAISI